MTSLSELFEQTDIAAMLLSDVPGIIETMGRDDELRADRGCAAVLALMEAVRPKTPQDRQRLLGIVEEAVAACQARLAPPAAGLLLAAVGERASWLHLYEKASSEAWQLFHEAERMSAGADETQRAILEVYLGYEQAKRTHGGQHQERLEEALASIDPQSPLFKRKVTEYGIRLIWSGMLDRVSAAAGHPPRSADGDDYALGEDVATAFVNAVECGRLAQASGLHAWLQKHPINHEWERWIIPAYAEAAALMQCVLLEAERFEPEFEPNHGIASIVFGGRDEILTQAEATTPKEALGESSIWAYSPIRYALCLHDAELARQLLELRKSRSKSAPLDDLFLARVLLLEGDRGGAAKAYAKAVAACELYGSMDRLRFELLLARDLDPADMPYLGTRLDDRQRWAPPTPVFDLANGIQQRPGSMGERDHDDGWVGVSAASDRIRAAIREPQTKSDSVILHWIEGEPGAGKYRLAQLLHRQQSGLEAPLRVLDCAMCRDSDALGLLYAIPGGGAHPSMGLIHQVEGGTLVIANFERASGYLQRILTHLIERRPALPLTADDRVWPKTMIFLCANSMSELQYHGRIDDELMGRLSDRRIVIPPLRERREDIIPLLYFDLVGEEYRPWSIARDAVREIEDHRWPGNGAELHRFAAHLRKSKPTRLVESGDLAAWLPALAGDELP